MKQKIKFFILGVLLLMSVTQNFANEGKYSLRSDMMKQQGIVDAQFIFEDAPFKSCHASTIAQTRDFFVVGPAGFRQLNKKYRRHIRIMQDLQGKGRKIQRPKNKASETQNDGMAN